MRSKMFLLIDNVKIENRFVKILEEYACMFVECRFA